MTTDPIAWESWATARPAPRHIHSTARPPAARRSRFSKPRPSTPFARQPKAPTWPRLPRRRRSNRCARTSRRSPASIAVAWRSSRAPSRRSTRSCGRGRSRQAPSWPWRAASGVHLHALRLAGLETDWLEVDDAGLIDLDALGRRLERDPPALVHVTHHASHRALRQPVAEIATICWTAGVPVWVDAAQAIGHCDIDVSADVLYATSRKWLAGPRGVGILAVSERFRGALSIDPKPLVATDAPVLMSIESHETHVAGRIGLATAVHEYIESGPEAISERLDEVGKATRACLAELTNWTVVDAVDSPGAITAIAPTAGQDVFDVRGRLLRERSIVTTACPTARAPHDMTEPWLRISPHVDAIPEQIETLRDALASM